MNKETLKNLVVKGLEQNIVIVDEFTLEDGFGMTGIGCKIGDYAFYFGGSEVEDMSLGEYDFTIEESADMITNVIYEMYFDPETTFEALYYYHYLKENVKLPKEFILEFKVKTDKNGNTRYIGVDIENKVWSNTCHRMVVGDVPEITANGYKKLFEQLNNSDYKRVETIG